MANPAIDIKGQRFGSLVVSGRAESSKRGEARWSCECDCGAQATVRGTDLRKGHTVSCGCARTVGVLKDQPLYVAAHQRIHRDRGKASFWPCVDCAAPAGEWSYDGTDADELTDRGRRYSLKAEHYSPRCVPCHRAYDENPILTGALHV